MTAKKLGGEKKVTEEEFRKSCSAQRVPRGPSVHGGVTRRYALAFNLWKAAWDHKKTCFENCGVSLHSLNEAAKFIMYTGGNTPPEPESSRIDERDDFDQWEWPS
jgi:hypothetical protein